MVTERNLAAEAGAGAVVAALASWQRRLGLGERAFARFLGCHAHEWLRLKRQGRLPSHRILALALARGSGRQRTRLLRAYAAELRWLAGQTGSGSRHGNVTVTSPPTLSGTLPAAAAMCGEDQ